MCLWLIGCLFCVYGWFVLWIWWFNLIRLVRSWWSSLFGSGRPAAPLHRGHRCNVYCNVCWILILFGWFEKHFGEHLSITKCFSAVLRSHSLQISLIFDLSDYSSYYCLRCHWCISFSSLSQDQLSLFYLTGPFKAPKNWQKAWFPSSVAAIGRYN